ncbi:erythromycin esterase family protein [Actinomadura sp. 21ATH]|uniref:erythromycin esterase family protein n=1 Tax=Actinomadura sp. 21ATH TaxID=1735444 RepID=UPI0035C1C7AE
MTGNDENAGTGGGRAAARWIAARARPLDAPTAAAPLTDLEPLRGLAGGAAVVGMGAVTRGAHEVSVLQHRTARFLVEELGFRTLALEEDWTTGLALDAYARTGEGDPHDLLTRMWLPWRTQEMLDVLLWMRAFNERHPVDPVRFLGLDLTATGPIAYDAVTDHVRDTAPERLPELDAHYAPLRPAGAIDDHVGRYRALADKDPYIEHARRAYDLVAALPPAPGRAAARKHAQAIVDFHLFHSRPVMEALPYVERRFAENLLQWHEETGSRIAYWGGAAHAAPAGGGRPNAGGHLRRALGGGYLSIGFTFGRGAVHRGVPVPPPPADFADAVLDEAAPAAHYLADLRAPEDPAAAAWLTAPARIRVIGPGYRPEDDPDHHVSGASPGTRYDVAVHSREVTPSRPAPASA